MTFLSERMLTSVIFKHALTVALRFLLNIFMQEKIPMCDAYVCTEMIGLRVDPELKDLIKTLRAEGVNTPKLMREAIRTAAQAAKAVISKAG